MVSKRQQAGFECQLTMIPASDESAHELIELQDLRMNELSPAIHL